MNKERHILLKMVLPALVINIMNMGVIHAADDSTGKAARNESQTKDMPAPPAGPYRSLRDVSQTPAPQLPMQQSMPRQQQMAQQVAPNINNRQWIPPARPQWNQQQRNQQQRMPGQQMPMQQQMAPQAAPNFNNRQWMPPVPPQWNQQQRRQVPPQAAPNFNNRQWTPPTPPRWNQQGPVVPQNYAPYPQNRRW